MSDDAVDEFGFPIRSLERIARLNRIPNSGAPGVNYEKGDRGATEEMERPMLSKNIYKYTLTADPRQFLTMPRGSEILSVGRESGESGSITLWAKVRPDGSPDNRIIYCRFTNDPAPDGKYIGTVINTVYGVALHFFDGGEG